MPGGDPGGAICHTFSYLHLHPTYGVVKDLGDACDNHVSSVEPLEQFEVF